MAAGKRIRRAARIFRLLCIRCRLCTSFELANKDRCMDHRRSRADRYIDESQVDLYTPHRSRKLGVQRCTRLCL